MNIRNQERKNNGHTIG
uniref:Uncharacterized protein n=1 Tax=Rhizophora mucronata TaxID=61149 RepID=A0A2P2P3I8_RHIMU